MNLKHPIWRKLLIPKRTDSFWRFLLKFIFVCLMLCLIVTAAVLCIAKIQKVIHVNRCRVNMENSVGPWYEVSNSLRNRMSTVTCDTCLSGSIYRGDGFIIQDYRLHEISPSSWELSVENTELRSLGGSTIVNRPHYAFMFYQELLKEELDRIKSEKTIPPDEQYILLPQEEATNILKGLAFLLKNEIQLDKIRGSRYYGFTMTDMSSLKFKSSRGVVKANYILSFLTMYNYDIIKNDIKNYSLLAMVLALLVFLYVKLADIRKLVSYLSISLGAFLILISLLVAIIEKARIISLYSIIGILILCIGLLSRDTRKS